MTETTRILAEYIRDTRYEDITSEVIEKSKSLILDCLGCGFGGLNDRASRIIVDYVKEFGGKPQASVLGASFKSDVGHAALANGVIFHALDFDDYHDETVVHATASCLPALLALAEYRKFTGREILTALVVGIDISVRLSLGLGSYHYELGWHTTSTAGRFGATAAVAKLLNLDTDKIVNAFGICGTQAAGVRQVFGTMSKPFNAGKASMDGLMSVLLAERGFTSSKEIIEGKLGILDVMTRKPHKEKIVKELGFKNYLLDICIKPYPSCA